MAENATVGALRVVLGLDTAKFEEGLKRSTTAVNSFGKQMSAVAVGTTIARAIEGVARSFISLATSALATGDALFKTSQKLGIPVEQLSVLKHAADLADVSFEELSKSFVIMAKNMNAAAAGQITPATAALQALGFNLKEFGQLAPEEAFKRISDQFAQMQDGAGKTALAVAIFGRAGAQLIPMLNEGSAGLAKARTEAEQLGLVFTGQAGKSAEVFNDNMRRLALTFTGIVNQVTVMFLPALERLSQKMIDFVTSNNLVAKSAEVLGRSIAFVIDNINVLITAFGIIIGAKIVGVIVNIGVAFIALAKAIGTATLASVALNAAKTLTIAKIATFGALIIWATGNLPAFIDKLKEVGGAIANMLPADAGDAIIKTIGAIGLNTDALTKEFNTLKGSAESASNSMSGLKPPPAFSAEGAKSVANFSKEIQKIQLQTREARGDFDGFATGFVAAAQRLGLVNESASNLGTTISGLTEKQRQLNAVMLQNEAAQAARDAMPAWEQHSKQVERYQLLMREAGLSAVDAGILIEKSARSAGVAWDQAASQIAGDLAQGLGEFAQQNKKFAFAAKAAAIAQATINTYTAATKALATFPPPLSYIAAAAAVVAGLGYVARIQSQQAFATGGQFRVAGGLTGVDSEMVAFSATPGEIVDVRRPGQPGLGGGVQTIELKVPRAKDFFTENVRALVDTINSAAPDGYIIRMPAT